MKLLILCLFFGIIFANTEESFEKLVQMIEGLTKEVDHLKQNNKKMGRFADLKNEIKKLNASMSNQEERIQANEEDLKEVDNLKIKVENQEARILANKEDLKVVNDLKNNVNEQEARIHEDLKVVDNLKATVSKQKERIQTNEEDFKKVVDDLVKNQESTIQANEDGLEVSICCLNHKRKK